MVSFEVARQVLCSSLTEICCVEMQSSRMLVRAVVNGIFCRAGAGVHEATVYKCLPPLFSCGLRRTR